MIATITLNPAVDLFIETPEIEYDKVLRSTSSMRVAGGKGINVSRMLHALGEKTCAVVMVGGTTGQDFLNLARRDGIEVFPVETSAPTRINVVLHDISTGQHIKVNTPGEEMDPGFMTGLRRELQRNVGEMKALVLAGSLPPGLPRHSYAELVQWARGSNIPTFVDTTGNALGRVISEKPEVIKINRTELEEVLERPLPDAESIARVACQYVGTGIRAFCVTMAADGAVLANNNGAWHCKPPEVSDHRAVGAGDCFMAGLVSSFLKGSRGADLLAYATACGCAWAVRERQHVTIEEVQAFLPKINTMTFEQLPAV